MLHRKIFDYLDNWKSTPQRKPLLIKGQRQVGKTYAVREFSKKYEHFVEINFLENPQFSDIFDGSLSVQSIISGMKLYFDPSLFVPGSTLLFFDEIQECPKARTSLKWFAEDGSYDVIASGSMLGISDNMSGKGISVPVGYEQIVEMKALDFEEFLTACSIQPESLSKVRECIHRYLDIPKAYLSVFEKRFRDYMVVGGMPEAVQKFIDTGDYTASRDVILSLIQSARSDINRYNSGVNRIKAGECYDSIPYQLDQTNKKFMYSRISGEGSRKSAEKYMDNLLWIKSAGYGIFCYSLTGLGLPTAVYVDRSSFRVYMSDTGMLTNLYGMGSVRAILSSDFSYNMGAVAENAVADCLYKSGHMPMYYRRTGGDNRMELDFVIEMPDGITVIEVKSGKKREAPSLTKVNSKAVTRKIMLREGNIGNEAEDVRGYPLFTAAFIDELEGTM